MALHIVFIIIYFMLDLALDSGPTVLNVTMILQAGFSIFLAFNRNVNYVTPKMVFFVSAIIISTGNIIAQTNGFLESNINAYMKPEFIPQATLIWCVGASCIFLGYELVGKKAAPSLRYDLSKSFPIKFFPYILVISVFSTQLIAIFSFLGSFTKLIQLLGLMGIMFYSRLWAENNDRRLGSYAVTLVIIQTIVAMKFSYLRSALTIPVIVMAVGYFVGKKHVKYLLSYRVIPYVIFIGFFLSIFEDLARHRADMTAVVFEKLSGKEEKVGGVTDMVDLYEEEEYNGTFLERSAVIAQVTNILYLVDKKGFYNGLVSLPVVIALVPRFLWPNKPQIQLGAWFALETGTAYVTESGRANNSINMTVMGEMYMDFSWVGVILGCIGFGAIIAWFWNSVEYFSSPYNIIGILFGGYMLILSFGFGADIQIIVTYLSTYLILLALKKVIVNYIAPKT